MQRWTAILITVIFIWLTIITAQIYYMNDYKYRTKILYDTSLENALAWGVGDSAIEDVIEKCEVIRNAIRC